MLNEQDQTTDVTINASSIVVSLQCISRLLSIGGVKDTELATIGNSRDTMVKALEEATGVNYDQQRANQEAAQRQAIANAQGSADAPQEADAEIMSTEA